MAVQAATEKSRPRRLGQIPQLDVRQAQPALARPSSDSYVPAPKTSTDKTAGKSATKSADKSATKPVEDQGPRTEGGKMLDAAWAGTLGVGAGGLGYFFGKTMMNFVKDMGPLTLKNVVKGQVLGGTIAGLPFALVGDSFAYKKGEVSAQRYWGNVVSGTLSFGLWGVGAMAACALLPVGGFAGVLVGLAGGGLVGTLFDKTLGRSISTAVAGKLSPEGAKKAADGVVKYVTNPIDKFIVQPVKRNWKVFLLTGGAAGIYFGIKGNQAKPVAELFIKGRGKGAEQIIGSTVGDDIAKALAQQGGKAVKVGTHAGKTIWGRGVMVKSQGGKDALKGVGAMLGSAIPQMFGDIWLSNKFPMEPVKGVDIVPGEGRIFNKEDGHVIDKPAEDEAA